MVDMTHLCVRHRRNASWISSGEIKCPVGIEREEMCVVKTSGAIGEDQVKAFLEGYQAAAVLPTVLNVKAVRAGLEAALLSEERKVK